MLDVEPELLAAQKLLQVRPAIGCYARESRPGALIPDWQSVATPADAQLPMDAAVAGDGSLVRVRLSGGYVQAQRIVDPTEPASWAAASWSNVVASAAATPPAVFVDPQAGENVHILFVTTAASRVVKITSSTDYGANFGGASIIYTHGSGAVEYLGGAIRTQGARDLFVFWCHNASSRLMYVSSQPAAGGAWSAPAAWSLGALGACSGFDVLWCNQAGDFLLLLAGSALAGSASARLWWVVYGDGGSRAVGAWAWGVIEASDVAGFSYVGPRLADAGDVLRYAYLESWTGAGAYNRQQLGRPLHAGDWDQGFVVDPEPFHYEPSSAYAAVLCCFPDSLDLFLVGHDAAYYAGMSSALTDLSARVAGYDYLEEPERSRLVVSLDNFDGALDNAGADSDPYRSVRQGASLIVQHGLYVGATAHRCTLQEFQIEALEHTSDNKGRRYLLVHCLGWVGQLEQWTAGRLFQWTGGHTLWNICATISARVGFSFGSIGNEGSMFMMEFYPTFGIAPGVNGKVALRQAVGKGPDVLRFDGSRVLHKELLRAEAAVYHVGSADEHPVLLGSFVGGAMADNVVEVYGAAGALAAAFDWNDLALVGTRRRKVIDGIYATAAAADTRADGEIERVHASTASAGSATGSARGWIECFPIHGVELWDVLSVTSGRHGFTDRRYRVVGIRERWDWLRGVYKQRLGLVALE